MAVHSLAIFPLCGKNVERRTEAIRLFGKRFAGALLQFGNDLLGLLVRAHRQSKFNGTGGALRDDAHRAHRPLQGAERREPLQFGDFIPGN